MAYMCLDQFSRLRQGCTKLTECRDEWQYCTALLHLGSFHRSYPLRQESESMTCKLLDKPHLLFREAPKQDKTGLYLVSETLEARRGKTRAQLNGYLTRPCCF